MTLRSRWLTPVFVLALIVVPSAACTQETPPTTGALVERFIDAYNRHSVEAMLELAHPDIQWLSVVGETISVEADGAEALGEAMQGYFASVPSARSTVEAMMEAGRFVSVWERAHWTSGGREQSQTALSVYEVEDGRIRRVWYYPAQR